RVLVHAYWPCGRCEDCRGGWENTCPYRAHVGRNVPGAYAELIRVPARFALPLPEGVDYDAAVALSVAAGTAWHMLMAHAGLVGGYMGGPDVSINLPRMTATEVRIIGSGGWTQRTSERVLDLTGRGALVPIVDSTLPFERLPSGLEKLQSRETFGKVLVGV